MIFKRAEFFNFKVQFPLWITLLVPYLRNLSLTQGHKAFSSIFSSVRLTILSFIFTSLIHFHLTFVYDAKYESKLIFFFCIRISKCSSIVRLLFFHWSDFALSSKIKYPYTWVYFWILYFAPLTYLSIFMPIPHCREYHSFRISFENGWCWFSNFVFFSKVVLAILDALRFDRYISTKKLAEIWWGLN